MNKMKSELIDKNDDFHIIEGDIYDDLSDEESSSENEEIIEVEIASQDLDDFVSELKQIKNLESEIIAEEEDDEGIEEQEIEDDILDENHEITEPFNDSDYDFFNDDEEPNFEDSKEDIKAEFIKKEIIFDDENTEALIPITCLKTETKEVEKSFNGNLKKECVLKLHKLDDFLVMKWLKADKNFLKTRFSKLLIMKQEGIESNQDASLEPLELEDGKFMCGQCKKIYVSKKGINRHIRQFHQRSQLAQCDHCDYVGASASSLSFHVQSIHLKMFRYECPECHLVKSQQKSTVVKHLIDDHKIEESEAKKMVQSKLRLKNRAIGDKHSCSYCDYQSPSKFKLKIHINRKHAEEADLDPDPETICNLCQENFLDKDSKERHPCPVKSLAVEAVKDIHLDEHGMVACPACLDQHFENHKELKEHYANNHVNYIKPKKNAPKIKKNDEPEVNEDGNCLCDQCAFIGSKEDLAWHVKQIHKDRYVLKK